MRRARAWPGAAWALYRVGPSTAYGKLREQIAHSPTSASSVAADRRGCVSPRRVYCRARILESRTRSPSAARRVLPSSARRRNRPSVHMAASLAGVALAEVLVWPSVLMLMAMRCRSRLGGAAASLAALLQRSLAPHDGLQLLSQWVALHGCARRADCCTELPRAVPYSC